MHERLISWRRFGALLCTGALAISLAVATPLRPETNPDRTPAASASDDESGVTAARERAKFPRSVAWWPYTTGPRYGHVSADSLRAPDVIHTMVGSFRISDGLDIPAELQGSTAGLDQGLSQYFLVQSTEGGRAEFETRLTELGAAIVLHAPVNAVVARMDRAAYDAVSGLSIVQHIEPYHPALRIHPRVGKVFQASAAAAASPEFDLLIDLFRDEAPAPVVAAIEQLGGQVISVSDAPYSQLRARIHASKVVELAKLEPVQSIVERAPTRLHSNSALYLQSATASTGDFVFWKAGIDGDGEIIHQTDTGMSVDAGDAADTRAVSGWDPSNPDNCNVFADHRKVVCYRRASDDFTGGGGDLSACDSVDSGAFTHGQGTSGVALGNATRGTVPAPASPSPTDNPADPNKTWVRDYGNGIYIDGDGNGSFSEGQDTAFDGVAKGARIVFHDAASGCPDPDGIIAGNQRENIVEPWTEFGANIHTFSFGSGGGEDIPQYSGFGSAIDQAVLDFRANLVIYSAGNDGSKEDGAGSSATPGNIGNQATMKNGLAIGASQGVGGAMAFFSGEGPPGDASAGSPNLRVAPLLVAEGYEYGCRSEDGSGTEDQTGAANCFQFLTQGTSFSAPSVGGAAAVIGEYLAEGFYPDGTNANANNDNEKITISSAALTRAIMIAGAAPMGLARDSRQRRFNNVYGYGRVQLDRTLPLADYPNDTPPGMILHDLPGDLDSDGTPDGTANKPGLSLPSTLTAGQSETVDFEVLDNQDNLSLALVWDDAVTADGSLDRNLDLTLTYCGPDNNCGTSGDNVVWYGNVFSEDHDRDPVSFFDIDEDGTIDSFNYSMSQQFVEANPSLNYDDWRDVANATEAIYLPTEAVKPPGEDNFDTVQVGNYQLTIDYTDGTGAAPFAVAIVGPVAAGSAVRFEQNPAACNGLEQVFVTEVEDATDPLCPNAGACSAADISSRITVSVFDDTDALVDEETGLEFEQPDGNQMFYRLVSPLALSDVTAFEPGDGFLSVDNGYTLRVTYQDEEGAEPQERISRATVDCSPDIEVVQTTQLGPDFNFVIEGGCDTDNYLDQNEVFSFQAAYGNLDPIDLVDASVSLKACVSREDPTAENCTPFSAITIYDPVRQLGILPAGFVQQTRFGLEVTGVPSGRAMVDLDLCLSGSKTGQPVEDCTTFTVLAQADEEKHYYITDCPDGCTGVRYDRNNDEVYEATVSRNPFDTLDIVRRGLPEKNINYESLRDPADENANGVPDCEEGGNNFVCGNANFSGPWDFDDDREGFTVGVYELSEDSNQGITNWGEDTNWNDILDPFETDKIQSIPPKIDYNWGTGGGCGWASNSNGSGPGGVFHTGTIGNWASSHDTQECRFDGQISGSTICEPYNSYSTTLGEKFWFEFLRTPEIHPVHFGTDPRDGFDWRTQVLDWSWMMQWDANEDTIWVWEFDLDTTEGSSFLGDNIVHGIYGGDFGLLSGGNFPLYDGAFVFAATQDDANAPDYGNETNGTIGGNRAGKRGCWFNQLNTIPVDDQFTAADRPINLPFPLDDDCDNEFDLGPDGCPGTCGVDDDGNLSIDDPQEICPCKTCDGGPNDGRTCVTDGGCNPDPNDPGQYHCVLDVDANGVPFPYGDDICGGAADPDDGAPSTDEGVFSEFELASTSERVSRPAGPFVGNGVAQGGRPNGDMAYNTLEDFFDPVGSGWQAELGWAVSELEGTTVTPSYGAAIDEMVVEWLEVKPMDQTEDKCGVSGPAPEGFEGRCARVMLAEENNTFSGDRRLEVSVLDPVPAGNETTCPSGTRGVEVVAYSESEPGGETICLEETSAGGNHFAGFVQTTTRINKPGDGIVYTDYNGLDTPSLSVRYIDKNDGVHATDNGPDGQPGIAGFDDDGDGVVDDADELCPVTSTLAAGRSPHLPGQASRYSDDNCGCLDNPLVAATTTQFDVADVIIEAITISDDGDDDGWADPGEEVTVEVTFRNLADFPLTDVRFRAGTDSDKVECITEDTIEAVRLEPRGETGDRVTGIFSFIAGDATRSSISEEFRSTFGVTMNATAKASPLSNNEGRRGTRDIDRLRRFDVPISGFAVRQSFQVEHNLDVSGSQGSATTYTETFEGYTSDANLFTEWVPRNEGDDPNELDGNRCQYNDPFNPNGNNTEPEEYCELGEGTDNTVNDWHLSSTSGCDSQGLATCLGGFGRNSIKSHGPGDQSLAMNWLDWDYSGFVDNAMTYHVNRMQWVEMADSVQLRASGDASGNPPRMSMWTIISLEDGRLFNVTMPGMLDSATTNICVDRNGNNQCDTVNDSDGSERWEVLNPTLNAYSGWKASNFINCAYDPTDDGSTEDDFFENSQRYGPSTACYPNLSDSCLGRSSDPSGVITSVYQHPTCFPETGVFDSLVPGVYEAGAFGTGVWAKQEFELAPYAGQKILIRFLVTPTGIAGADLWGEFLGVGGLNSDDGWYVDDIEITGVSTSSFSLAIDNTGGGGAGSCPTTTCDVASARAAVLPYPRNDENGQAKAALACSNPGDVDSCDFDEDGTADAADNSADSPAPRQAFYLEARESFTDTCFGGAYEYHFETSTGEVLSDWSTLDNILVDPLETTTYNISVRCSTAPDTCLDSVSVTVVVPPYTPREGVVCVTDNLLFTTKQDFEWDPSTSAACPTEFDVVRGDIAASFFASQTCLENDITSPSASDATVPVAGNGFWYAATHTGEDGTYSTESASEEPGRDDNITACP